MVDWKSEDEIQMDSMIFLKFMHALLGLYIWELFVSLDFDWAVLRGKTKFRWPLIFYFAGRYLLLFALIGIAVALDTPKEINCQALYAFNQLAGNAAVGLASINLSLRTVAIWSQNIWIVILLVLIILGHWSLILQGVLLTAVWRPGVGCAITYSDTTILASTFIYSMCFDFVVMCLSAYKLAWTPTRSGTNEAPTRLVRMLFSDGLIYFFIAFVSNVIATTMMVLDLNAIMSVIFNVPAAIASTIVASRVVRRLANFRPTGLEMISLPRETSGTAFKNTNAGLSNALNVPSTSGIHVEMDTFAHPANIDLEGYPGVRRITSSAASYSEDRKPVQVI
ncbi:hypothetical protein DEU56DRAFT_255746 [Suillus clintonianus]|uniref:uncharacterized protein n=1 Tax=Suillus clintonianus TaxID=1904413 RepID=UPI001B864297|nr:uncharacterized protein DEU56DRAFT_255746 [Suillus clintonianus]KAG2143049.1 hypothetical protein DEU56DRAFT_255746 [Suillus clintonianus]